MNREEIDAVMAALEKDEWTDEERILLRRAKEWASDPGLRQRAASARSLYARLGPLDL